MSQHAGSERNGTHLIQCRSVNFKNNSYKWKMRTVFAELKIKIFPAIKVWKDRLPNTLHFNIS